MELVVIIPVAVFVALVALFIVLKLWFISDDDRREG